MKSIFLNEDKCSPCNANLEIFPCSAIFHLIVQNQRLAVWCTLCTFMLLHCRLCGASLVPMEPKVTFDKGMVAWKDALETVTARISTECRRSEERNERNALKAPFQSTLPPLFSWARALCRKNSRSLHLHEHLFVICAAICFVNPFFQNTRKPTS